MSQFPINTPDGLYEAVNYLASGPQGLGQNFAGFSSYTPAYLTGNYRLPFSSTDIRYINVLPITCSSAEQINSNTFKYVFASTQASPPFQIGNNISGAGWANSFYNGGQGNVGIIECTTAYVVFRTESPYPGIGDDFGGGTVYLDNMATAMSTDCNARVTVTSATDRIFIGSQLTNTISYDNSGSASDLTYTVQVNRYTAIQNDNPINPDYRFITPQTVFQKVYTRTGLTGTGTLPEIETIFSTVIDSTVKGYYWYILEVLFEVPSGSQLYITTCDMGLRSLSAQVVKQ